jgi:hypothetical protein
LAAAFALGAVDLDSHWVNLVLDMFVLYLCRYCDDLFNRVLAPEGESLSFASPKERNQRKGDPMPLASCVPRI